MCMEAIESAMKAGDVLPLGPYVITCLKVGRSRAKLEFETADGRKLVLNRDRKTGRLHLTAEPLPL